MFTFLCLGYLTQKQTSICLQISRCHCFLPLSSISLGKFPFFFHSSVEEYLGCFQVLAIMNNAAMNIVEEFSLWYGSVSFGYIPKTGIAGS